MSQAAQALAPVVSEPLTIKTACGRALRGYVFRPAPAGDADRPPRRAVLLLGALAAPQRYARALAEWLAARGDAVVTFDYRGTGLSYVAGDPDTNLDDWADDVRCAIATTRHLLHPERLLVIGHSIGGMLLGHAGVKRGVDGALLIGATHGLARYYRGKGLLRLRAAYGVLPRLARTLGELPGWPWLLGAAVPRDVVVHWARWGAGEFVRWDGRPATAAFAGFAAPLLSVWITDDDYAPVEAVDALVRHFTHAGTRREALDPRAHGDRIGHFGLFGSKAPEWARERVARWLDDLDGVS